MVALGRESPRKNGECSSSEGFENLASGDAGVLEMKGKKWRGIKR